MTRFRAPAAGRADKLLAAHFAGASRKRVAALFPAGHVRVDGHVARKGDRVPAGALIEVTGAPARAPDLIPAPQPELALAVLHEDAALVAVNKPAGVPSHPLRPGEAGTLASALVARYPGCATAGRDPREAGLAHRLDIDTSGVIVAARSRDAWDALRGAFAAGAVHKRYWALVHGAPRGHGCDRPLAHQGKRMVVTAPGAAGALPASTRWQVRERLGALCLVECVTATGRMHQVRAHLAWAGAPIAGDRVYGPGAAAGSVPEDVPLRGHFLHARTITLPHPLDGRALTIEAPLPDDRARALERLRGHGQVGLHQ